jgi:phosphotransacetylase
MVRLGSADAAVAGCRNPSGDVIRAGLHMIGLRPGHSTVSSSFLLRTPDGRSLAFGDCAVVPEPDETQLADIALATAGTFGSLTGEDPVVAMLSFSTLGSADHASVRRVREATRLVRERDPGLCVDGEMQFDAALVASVAEQKAAGSSVAGRANVFVFPNLAAGNIGYKIAQRLGGADAFGPILQGLRAPMNDLSRGCDAEDVVSVAVISALQAQAG